MYLYGSEHALMDYHLNPEKKAQVQEETPQTEKKDETDTTKTE